MKFKDLLAFVALSFMWGSSFFWIKIALQEVGPLTLVALRLLFGIIGLSIYASFVRLAWPKDKRIWINLFILGVINTALPFTLISWGEKTIDSGVASILNSSVPLFTALFAHLLLKDDRLSPIRAVGILIGFLGVVLVISQGIRNNSESDLLGQGAVLLAAISYSVAAVFARSKAKGIPPLVQSLGTLVMADAVLWTGVIVIENPFRVPNLPITWVALLWLGLVGSFLAYLLYYRLIQSIGPTRASMVSFIFPVVGMILGAVFLGEFLVWQVQVGGGMVVTSIVLANRKWM